ncbi:MAG: cytidylyltransferase domain-containing protein [Anaerolineales bacterium]
MTEVLAIIPARGGSKGIPRKNIRSFAGYPLIAYSIAAGLQAKTVTRVIASTDDAEIADVARQCGAETPFLRPAEFAQDNSTDLPLFQHALQWLDAHESYQPDVVVQLRPTSPLRPRDCVDRAVNNLLAHPDADSVRGVVSAAQNPYKMWMLSGEDAPMKNLLSVPGLDEPYNAPRQVLPPIYWQTGHIDAIRLGTILHQGSMSGERVYPLVIDARYTVDIDNLNDWARYEAMVYAGNLDIVSPGRARRPRPEKVKLIVSDFDGVFTDNRVWTDQHGKETVAGSRSDGLRIRELREQGIEVLILSSEENPVVVERAKKLGIEAVQETDTRKKGDALKNLLSRKGVEPANVIFMGNDVNDLPCFEIAGWSVAVADAYPAVLRAADYVLQAAGGHGAPRELFDLVLNKS